MTAIIEAMGGAPPVMLGIAAILCALAYFIREVGPELRAWVALRPGDLCLVTDDGHQNKAIGMSLDAPENPPEQGVPLAG